MKTIFFIVRNKKKEVKILLFCELSNLVSQNLPVQPDWQVQEVVESIFTIHDPLFKQEVSLVQ